MHFYNNNNNNNNNSWRASQHAEDRREESKLEEKRNDDAQYNHHIGGKGRLLLQVTECVIDTYHAVVDTCKQRRQSSTMNTSDCPAERSLQDKIQDLEQDNKDLVSILRETQKQLAEALEAKVALQNELKQVMGPSSPPPQVQEVVAEPIFQQHQPHHQQAQQSCMPFSSAGNARSQSQPQDSSYLFTQQHCCVETVCYDDDEEEPQWLFLEDQNEELIESKHQQHPQRPLPAAAATTAQQHGDVATVLAMALVETTCTTIQSSPDVPTSATAGASTTVLEAYVVQVIHEEGTDAQYYYNDAYHPSTPQHEKKV